MIWTEIDIWIVVIGAICAMACAMPGCLLVLRRMSLMGDAISHTVLPGIAIAAANRSGSAANTWKTPLPPLEAPTTTIRSGSYETCSSSQEKSAGRNSAASVTSDDPRIDGAITT
mgnify:CR=1 FL=1